MKILVGIPCYNCENQITRVLEKLKTQHWNCHFIFLDNQSTDRTFDHLKMWKEKNSSFPATLIRHNKNYGLGGSFKSIVHEALQDKYDFMIIYHGDDQASPKDLNHFIEIIDRSPSLDCILGARFMKGSQLNGYSLIRKWGNQLFNKLFSIALGRKIHDIGSGLNAFKVNSLPLEEIPYYPEHMAYDLLLLFHYMQPTKKTVFVPIHWEEKDQVSNAKNIETGFRVIQMLENHLKRESFTHAPLRQRSYSEHIK